MSTEPDASGWIRYDGVASTYARVAEPYYFAAPARDLATLLELRRGDRVLDVGAGTGAVIRAAAEADESPALLVAVDGAMGMLVACRRATPGVRAVVAALPSLPCAPVCFDVATGAFVLSHVADWRGSLETLREMLRPRGRLGLLSWITSPSETPPGRIWSRVTGELVDRERLDGAMAVALPSEERFASRAATETAVRSAGFEEIRLVSRTYRVEMPTTAYVESRSISVSSRFARLRVSEEEWGRVVANATRALHDAFGARLIFDLEALLTVGIRMGGS